jgi:hypothetical protein
MDGMLTAKSSPVRAGGISNWNRALVVPLQAIFFKARIPPFRAGEKPTTPIRSTIGYKPNTTRQQTFIRFGCEGINAAK